MRSPSRRTIPAVTAGVAVSMARIRRCVMTGSTARSPCALRYPRPRSSRMSRCRSESRSTIPSPHSTTTTASSRSVSRSSESSSPSRSAPAWSSSRYMSTCTMAGAPAAAARCTPRQHEGRRRHRPVDVHGLRDPLGQHGLSRTQRSGQHDHVAGAQLHAELARPAPWCRRLWAAPLSAATFSHGVGPDRATAGSSRRVWTVWRARPAAPARRR